MISLKKYSVSKVTSEKFQVTNGRPCKAGQIIVILALVVLTILRIMMSFTLHMWYAWNQTSDDQLLMSYSFREHFAGDNDLSLAKNAGYGYWIALCSKMGVTPDLSNLLVWLIAAVMMGYAMWHVFRRKLFSVASYLYVLWNPLAFENWLGTRIYRNSLFAPLFFILLALLILHMTWFISLRDKTVSKEKLICSRVRMILYPCTGIMTGFLFAFLYILKEDSVWMIPMFLFCVGYAIVALIRYFPQKSMKLIVVILACCPLASACIGISGAKAINYRYFGVYMLNTRTEGELDGFLQRVYSINNPEQTADHIWAPVSSFEKASEASATLRHSPEFLEKFKTVGFMEGKPEGYVISGDLVAWQLRIAITQSIGWSSEQQVQHYFAQVNKELDDAFSAGKLQKSGKMRMLPSAVPRSGKEILSLMKPTFVSWTWGFNIANQFNVTKTRNVSIQAYLKTNPPQRLADYFRIGFERLHIDADSPSPEYFHFFKFENAQKIATVLVWAYTLFNVVALVVIICLTGFRTIRKGWKNIIGRDFLILAILLALYPLAYCFSVNWFAEYVHNAHVIFFYTAGATVPMMGTALLLGLGVLTKQEYSEYSIKAVRS